jgi:DNA repair protein RadC
MFKKYDAKHAESFLKGLRVLTGIPYKKLEKYANENNLFNILEHPNTIEPNQRQLQKISLLNEFIASYRLLKMQEEENKITLMHQHVPGVFLLHSGRNKR